MAYNYDPQLDAFELYHQAIENESKSSLLGGPALPALGHAVSGAAGSAISTVITYPLSLLVTRMQVQRQLRKLRNSDTASAAEYTDIVDAAKKIYAQEGGLSAFYSGCAQDSAKTVADAFLFFLAYNFVKESRLKKHETKRLPVLEELGVGMLAGAFGRVFTTPIQNIVTRKQTATMICAQANDKTKSPTATEIARQIQEEKGILGFWSGYSATLILTFNPALTFLLQETFLRILVKRENRSNPGSKKTFIIAALSKAIASSITYPFSLAKSRLQVSSKAPTDPEKITTHDSTKEAAHKTARAATKQQSIFSMIIQIAREEGILSLYQGLEGEVLKAFFSHGFTMLIKERIHKVVIQTYYLVLRLSKKYPNPEKVAKSAAQTVSEKASLASDKAQDAVKTVGTQAQEAAKSVGSQAQEAAKSASTQAQESSNQAMTTVTDLYHHGKEIPMEIWDEYLMTDDDDY